eukprot:TRINITY_DN8910_c0_g1_i2.p4 TRINITY_DN8910_c0_g1~~TRINITY_DN8910_c0_g1_i2.p4  ORF type:complete len:159 (-),score=13.84 TRINITY_DN8910_c0_g1_i2:41-517(-)
MIHQTEALFAPIFIIIKQHSRGRTIMPVEKNSSYPCKNMDHYIMNRVLRHRLRNLCAGVKMTIERIAASTMQSNPQIGSRCDIVAAELDSLREFTDRMDMLFDRLPSPEVKSLFMMITDMRMDFLKNYPFCNFEINGCLLYTSPSPRDRQKSRMPSSA